jgi:hypothetical protein
MSTLLRSNPVATIGHVFMLFLGAVDYALVAKHSKLVVDTRNAMRHVADRTRIVKA